MNPSLSTISYLCETFVLALNVVTPGLFLYGNIFAGGESKTSLIGACTCGFIMIIAQLAFTITYLWLSSGDDFMVACHELERLEADLLHCKF
jgi:hypothetical protein